LTFLRGEEFNGVTSHSGFFLRFSGAPHPADDEKASSFFIAAIFLGYGKFIFI
jgi:hypothetical protein